MSPTPGANEERDQLMAAMVEELERSLEGLSVEDTPEPYFMAYSLRRNVELRFRAAYGRLTRDREARRHHVHADVRVGDASFDNVLDGGLNVEATERESADWLEAADDLDPALLRVALWKLSEIKFDEAVEDYYDHKKAFVSEFLRDEVDAMGPAEQLVHLEDAGPFELEREAWRERVKKASARFAAEPDIYDPSVELYARQLERWYVNAEGTRVFTRDVYWDLRVTGWVLSDDGVYLEGSRSVYGRSLASLPAQSELEALVEGVLDDLEQLREAESPGSFIGPALLSGQAAATVFHEALGHRLEGERLVARGETRTFAHKLQERILPAGLDVYDDPSQRSVDTPHGTRELWGHFRVDDEGVPTQRCDLVKDGVLVGFLQSRKPTPHAKGSNGHGRHDGVQPVMARMGNLFIQPTPGAAAKDRASLEAELLSRAKAGGHKHALIVEHIRAGETSTDSYDFQVFKGELSEVYLVEVATGERRRVRDLELIGTPLSVMQRIVAFGDESGVDYGSCFAESGAVPVSGVAPALLLSEVELQQKSSSGFHEPLLPPPFADDGSRGRHGGPHERGRRRRDEE